MQLDTLFPVNFSNSMLTDLATCELKFFRSQIQKLNNNETSHHLIAGGHFAAGCEIVRKSYFNELKSVDDSIEAGYTYILLAEDTGDNLKSNERMALTLKKYFETFPLDAKLSPCRLSDGTFAIEYSFEFNLGIPHPEIPDTNLVYKGKLDGLYERTTNAGILQRYVVDEKTCSSVLRITGTKSPDLNKESNAYLTDSQLISYHWAARKLGVTTDASLIRKVPILTKHEDAFELEIPVTQFMVDQWWNATRDTIHLLIEKYNYYKAKGELPQVAFKPIYKGTSCTVWGSKCKYMAGCMSKDGEEIISNSFQQIVRSSEDPVGVTLAEYKKLKGVI
jgi:hypothetical protein